MPLFVVKSSGATPIPYEWSAKGIITIGRASLNEICISDPLVSSVHAEVRFDNDEYFLQDLGSRTGTYYDGRFVTSPVSLSPGGRIYLGSTEIEVRDVLEGDIAGLTIRPVFSFKRNPSIPAGNTESNRSNLLLALTGLDGDTDWLVPVLFERAAKSYEASNLLREAAVCWMEAGNTGGAIEIYLRTNEYSKAAPLLMEKGRYAEALKCYFAWLASLRKDNSVSRIRALLGVALSLRIMKKEPDTADAAWREARSLAEVPKADRLVAGSCWEALGEYGARIGRTDLVQVGYEQALQAYGNEFNDERTSASRNYLAAVENNRLLVAEIETRLAEWNPQVEELAPPPDAGDALVMGARFGEWTVWRPGPKEVVAVHAESNTAIQIWTDSPGWFRSSRGKEGYQVSSEGSVTRHVGPIRIARYIEKVPTASLTDVSAEVANYTFTSTREGLRITNKVKGGTIVIYPNESHFDFIPHNKRAVRMR